MSSGTRILVIFTSAVVRRLVERYLIVEFEEVELVGAASLAEAAPTIRGSSVDVVVAEISADPRDDRDLLNLVRGSSHNREAAIVLVASRGQDPSRWAREEGVAVLTTPFGAGDLREAIQRVFSARRKRRTERYHVPGARAVLGSAAGEVAGPVINLSMHAALVDLQCAPGIVPELLRAMLSLHIPRGTSITQVRAPDARLLRLQIVDWDRDKTPSRVRGVWLFGAMSDHDRDLLATELMEQAAEEARHAELLG